MRRFATVFALITASGCTAAGGGERDGEAAVLGEAEAVPTPTGPGAGEPDLHRAEDGRILLSWLEPVDGATAAGSTRRGEYALRFSVLEPELGGWSAPRTVVRDSGLFVNWADFPSVTTTSDGALVAHWLARTGGTSYAYAVRTARSTDGGATWSPATSPHADTSPTEHGFVTLVPGAAGAVDAVWLDGRDYDGAEAAGRKPQMALRHARLLPRGDSGPETVLDPRVCDCCQTAAARTDEGLVVIYRDRSPEEVRDISVVRQVGDRWTEPVRLHADDWRIDACPVNGPALAADGRRLAAAWFTAAADTPRVRVAFSADAGATWSAPVQVDGGRPAGRVDVGFLPDGAALVSWVESGDAGAELRVRRITRAGTADAPRTIAGMSGARASGFPRMAVTPTGVLFAWTEPGDTSRVRLARLPLAGGGG